ncbi:hypothetical protein BEH94_04795 [Candidatus Altiarchaeales archaeon WOR_SM1_SCG]|nr:hypothetical protein BEH94_04795 [Candidatus Altiarchaeales archaeon WOR_SM1_SCG]
MTSKEILKEDYYEGCRDECPFLKFIDPRTQETYYAECKQKCPVIKLKFEVKGKTKEEFAYVDTGYQRGYLRIPAHYAKELGKPTYHITASMPDDSLEERIPRYFGRVDIGGVKIPALISCAGTKCLLGRKIIDKFELHFDKGEKLKVYK